MGIRDESVYELIPAPQPRPERPPMHRSAHPGKLDRSTLVYPMGLRKQPDSHKTFGRPDRKNAQDPQQFTRARSGAPSLPTPVVPPEHPKDKVKGVTPKRDEKPLMNLCSGKDFVKSNAVEAILSKPKPCKESRPWTMRKGFGEVPKYLETIKRKIATEKAQVEEYLRARNDQTANANVTQLDNEERETLLAHLKTKWSSLNTAFQKMTFTLDTPAKRKRKETYEEQLAEIEKDIKLLEKGEIVVVVEE